MKTTTVEIACDASTMELEAVVTTTEVLSDQRLASLLCCGFEGGVGYWCTIVDFETPEEVFPILDRGHKDPKTYPHNEFPLLPEGTVICQVCIDANVDENGYCVDDTGERLPMLKLDREAIARGLQVMADKYPHHMRDFLDEKEDSETGDVFIQCCLLGEVVYG